MKPSAAALAAADAMETKIVICPGYRKNVSCGKEVVVHLVRAGRRPSRCDFCRVKRLLWQKKKYARTYHERRKKREAAAILAGRALGSASRKPTHKR